MPEINATAAPPEHVQAVRVLAQQLLGAVHASPTPVALDSLISVYVSLAVRGGAPALQSAIKGIALVRVALLGALRGPAEVAPIDQVAQLANLVLLPDLASHQHDVALSALLSVYRDLLNRPPCCAESHAVQLFALWQQASASAGSANSSQSPVH